MMRIGSSGCTHRRPRRRGYRLARLGSGSMLNLRKRALPVKSMSRKTALSCIRQLSRSGKLPKLTDIEHCGTDNTLLLGQFIALSRPEFRVRPVVLNWQKLAKTVQQQNIFLILQNGNVISATGTGRRGRD